MILIVLILGAVAAVIVGVLLGRALNRIEAARVAAECPDCAWDVFHNVCTTRAERAEEVDKLLATLALARANPAPPSRDESS